MSIEKSALVGAEHPLFRALVLMGGGLALSCGGISQTEQAAPPNAASGGSGGGSGSGGNSGSGDALGDAGSSAAGMPGTIVIEYPDAGAPLDLKCPYAQWSCAPACYMMLANSGDPADSGCSCDSTRPTSVAACAADESLICVQAYLPYPYQENLVTWDGSIHVSCLCVTDAAPSEGNCGGVCQQTYSQFKGQSQASPSQCQRPAETTCDGTGTCTANSASVLRQDGIMCGCADITLK